MDNMRPADWRNPQPAQRYDLVIVGAGTTGLVAAHTAAAEGATVALIERHLLGGTCLNIGCVPSKAIIRTSRLYAEMRHANRYGALIPADIRVDFPAVMQRMRGVRARISRADSARRLTETGVDVFFGQATFTGTDALDVDGAKLRFNKALIAMPAAIVRSDDGAGPGPRTKSRQATSAVAARAQRHRNRPRKRAALERATGHYCSIRSLRRAT